MTRLVNRLRYRALVAVLTHTAVGRALLFNEWAKGYTCARHLGAS